MLEVKKSYAERMEKEAISDLVKEKKGILILDLDHTVFQVTLRQITQEVKGFETWNFATEMDHSGVLLEGKTYWFNLDSSPRAPPFFIHLRPGLYSFIRTASSMFELYAYTQGTQEYAKKLLGAIDPTGDFFGSPHRLIARELDPATGQTVRKNLSRVFPNEEALVLIIDDRDDVWDSQASLQNLIKLTPFMFFQDKEREKLFSVTPTSDPLFHPLTDNGTIRPTVVDKQLVYLENVLADLHGEAFFSSSEDQQPSLQSVFFSRKSNLFSEFEFLENDRVGDNVFRIVRQYGGKIVAESEAGHNPNRPYTVLLGIPGQSRRGSQPELIHPWFVLFCVSTLTVPSDPELFSVARIEQEGITNMWEVVNTHSLPLGSDAAEDDLLNDLLG